MALTLLIMNIWRWSVKVGDLVELPQGTRNHWGLPTGVALLLEKLPRPDCHGLEYDWRVLVDGRYLEFGKQIENSAELVSEGR